MQDLKAAEEKAAEATQGAYEVSEGEPQEHLQETYNEAAHQAQEHIHKAAEAMRGYGVT